MTFSIWLGVTFPELPPNLVLDAIAVVITPEGLLAAVKPEDGSKQFKLKELQTLVGGYVQVVPFKHGLLVCDEDGKSKHAPVNKPATYFLRSLLNPGDFLVGNVLVCKKDVIA